MRLYGKNSVIERLRSNPQSIRKMFLEEGHSDAAYFRKKAKKWGIPLLSVGQSQMLKMARNANTQGIMVEIGDFHYTNLDELLETSLKNRRALLFLDGLNDPQNLGGIIRSLACLGHFSIILPTHDSVEVTETVLRVASGGDNYVLTSKVSNLVKAINEAKQAGFRIAGAVTTGGQNLMESQLKFPIGIVVGNEQKGIRDIVRKNLDFELTIPMTQQGLSFNVAHATAVLAYEVVRQNLRKKIMPVEDPQE